MFLPKIKVDKLYFHEKIYNYLRFSPRHQVGRCDNQMILNKLLEQNILQFSPSRRVRGHYENAYDDRYVVQNAAAKEGIIVSNDHFRDLIGEDEAFKEAI